MTDAEAEAVRQALDDAGSRAFVEGLVVDYVDAAVRCAGEAGLPAELVDGLAGLCVAPAWGAA